MNGVRKVKIDELTRFKNISLINGKIIEDLNIVLVMTETKLSVEQLNLSNTGVKQDLEEYILHVKYSVTDMDGIHALVLFRSSYHKRK